MMAFHESKEEINWRNKARVEEQEKGKGAKTQRWRMKAKERHGITGGMKREENHEGEATCGGGGGEKKT